MTLTPFERLTLINQFKTLKVVEDTDDYDRQITILEEGYEAFYKDTVFNQLSTPIDATGCKFVTDVLTMYRYLDAYLDEVAPMSSDIRNLHFVQFLGFDGNAGDGFRHLAKFLITTDSFSEQLKRRGETDDFNSHAPVNDTYRAMLARFEEWRDRTRMSMKGLNTEDVLYIVTGS